MRGQIYKRRETAKHSRRLLLASLLVASGHFAQAEAPLAMVPLPLTPLNIESGGVRSNPFCQPVVLQAANTNASFSPPPVRVAQRQDFSGLGRVGANNWHPNGASNSGDVVLASGVEMKRRDQPVAGGVGLRSFLQSPLVEAAGGVRANPLATKFTSDVSLEPKVDIDGVRALKAAAEQGTGFSFSLSDEDRGDDLAAEKPSVGPVAEPPSGEPVELSFSDVPAMPIDQGLGSQSGDGMIAAPKHPTTRPVAAWRGTVVERAPAGLPEPINLRELEPEQFAAGRILQVPPLHPEEIVREEPVPELQSQNAFEVSPGESRLVNGGRPRVEVGRPPVAIDRLASTSIVAGKPRLLIVDTDESLSGEAIQASHERDLSSLDAIVEAVTILPAEPKSSKSLQSVVVPNVQPTSSQGTIQEPNHLASGSQPKDMVIGSDLASSPAQKESNLAKEVEETIVATFNLKPTEVRAIKFDSQVKQVQSDNMAVCAAIKAATGQIQLIATGAGTTRLSVHTIGKDGVGKTERYEVSVGDVRTSTDDSPESIAMTLTQTVQSAFPGSNILVSFAAGRLVVTGTCPDEEAARRMLRMIRSACAIPVVDNVKVR